MTRRTLLILCALLPLGCGEESSTSGGTAGSGTGCEATGSCVDATGAVDTVSTGDGVTDATGGGDPGPGGEDTGLPCEAGASGCPCYPNGTCDNGLTCSEGVCAACPEGAVGCPCYANGTCDSDLTCESGVCAGCPVGTTGCPCDGGACTDGVCVSGVCQACADGTVGCPCTGAGTCTGGRCVEGACVPCEDGATGCPCTPAGTCDDGQCSGGQCVACTPGAVGCPCDAGACAGGWCDAGTCAPCQAGRVGCPCGAGGTCDDGVCSSGTCVPCQGGMLGCPCDAGSCTAGACVQGTCVDCVAGSKGCACHPDQTCGAGLKCSVGVCVVCPAGARGCACGTGGVCGSGLSCQSGLCLDTGCSAGTLGCPCQNGGCAAPEHVCLAGICEACVSWVEGCPCDNGACGGGLVCDADAQTCRPPKDCQASCALHQTCEAAGGSDAVCLEACEDGWAWENGACAVAVPPTCTPDVPGSLVQDCEALHRICDADADPAACGVCVDFYVDEGGALDACRPTLTCAGLGCAGQNRSCTAATATSDAICGACLPNFLEDGGVCRAVATCASLGCAAKNRACVAATASTDAVCGACLEFFVGSADVATACTAVATCASLGCAAKNRPCTPETATQSAVCGPCPDFYVDDGDAVGACREVIACAGLSCAAANRTCIEATATTDGYCGTCLPGFQASGDTCIAAPKTCQAADPGDITAACAAENRKCVHLDFQEATCGGCLDGYGETGEGVCVQVVTCADIDCEAKGRACAGEYPVKSCGACLDGRVPSQVDPDVCVPLLTCDDLTCAEEEFCLPGDGETTSAECFTPSCPAGQAYSAFAGGCVQCVITCGDDPGETTRVWPISLQNSSFCLCETKTGYYWEEGDDRSAQPCDADGDGWVRSSARIYVESADPSLALNARCSVRKIDRVVLQNELGQRLPIRLCAEEPQLRKPGEAACGSAMVIPLYESPRNDDDQELAKDSLVPGWSYGQNGRQVRAAEVNPLTRACLAGADLNGNQVTDISEWHGMPKPGPMAAETYVFLQFSYFMELHRSWYEPGAGAGQYVVAERSRCEAGFPFDYQTQGDYWRSCTRSRDVAFNPADGPAGPEFGLDFAKWSCDAVSGSCPIPPPPTNATPGVAPPVHGLCDAAAVLSDDECGQTGGPWPCVDGAVWRGMSHHSQFKCVMVSNTPSTTEPREPTASFYPIGQGQALLGACHVACPAADPDCAADCAGGVCATSSVAATKNPSSPVVSCELNSNPVGGDVGFRMALFQPEPADYTRGCIDEWRPAAIQGAPTGVDDPIAGAWRALCPGWSDAPTTVLGEGSASDFGRLQCGCGTRYGGPSCNDGCPGDRHHTSEGYVPVPRNGFWMCGEVTASAVTGPDTSAGLALVGGGWVLRGGVPEVPTDGEPLGGTSCDGVIKPADAYGSPLICGASPDCVAGATWDLARQTCEAAGMRLCTQGELLKDEARGTGCLFDAEYVWSRTACEGGGRYVVMGASNQKGAPECRDPSADTAAVRCCAGADRGFAIH